MPIESNTQPVPPDPLIVIVGSGQQFSLLLTPSYQVYIDLQYDSTGDGESPSDTLNS
jgi:hypothetical protein